ncbi:unnamed protein product, partial [Prorocentrum cordatum]
GAPRRPEIGWESHQARPKWSQEGRNSPQEAFVRERLKTAQASPHIAQVVTLQGLTRVSRQTAAAMSDASADPPPGYAWVVLVVLTMLSGMFSGLNLGLMSLTVEDLNIVINSGEDQNEVAFAKQILPLRKHGNLLLCTLLIGNTLVNVMLAVITDPIWVFLFGTGTVGSIFALALPSALIVVFGEIVPQSVCSRYALLVGARTLPITYIFVAITFVLAYPISKILDRLLGDEIGGVYTRKGLLQLVKLSAEDPSHAHSSGLNQEDAKVLTGALTFQDRTVRQVMTPISQVFSLPKDAVLDRDTFLAILQKGHTRIPVYDGEPTNIFAILNVKFLLGIGFERKMTLASVIQDFRAENPRAFQARRVVAETKCDVALGECKRERVHILVVTETRSTAGDSDCSDNTGTGPAIGIMSIEDVIEEILQDEIVDATDEYVDHTQKLNTRRVDATTVLQKLPGMR